MTPTLESDLRPHARDQVFFIGFTCWVSQDTRLSRLGAVAVDTILPAQNQVVIIADVAKINLFFPSFDFFLLFGVVCRLPCFFISSIFFHSSFLSCALSFSFFFLASRLSFFIYLPSLCLSFILSFFRVFLYFPFCFFLLFDTGDTVALTQTIHLTCYIDPYVQGCQRSYIFSKSTLINKVI